MLWNINDEFGNEVSEFENFVPTRWLVTFGGTFVAGPDSWPIAEPPVEASVGRHRRHGERRLPLR